MSVIGSAVIGQLIEAHRAGDEHQFYETVKFMVQAYKDAGDKGSASLLCEKMRFGFDDFDDLGESLIQIGDLTKEEIEKAKLESKLEAEEVPKEVSIRKDAYLYEGEPFMMPQGGWDPFHNDFIQCSNCSRPLFNIRKMSVIPKKCPGCGIELDKILIDSELFRAAYIDKSISEMDLTPEDIKS